MEVLFFSRNALTTLARLFPSHFLYFHSSIFIFSLSPLVNLSAFCQYSVLPHLSRRTEPQTTHEPWKRNNNKKVIFIIKNRTAELKSKAEVEAGQSLATYPEALCSPVQFCSTLTYGIPYRTVLRLWFHLHLDCNMIKLQLVESYTTN